MSEARTAVLCFGHRSWEKADALDRELMSRWAAESGAVFVEPPATAVGAPPRLRLSATAEGVLVARPELPRGAPASAAVPPLLAALLAEREVRGFVAWVRTPLAAAWLRPLPVAAVVYDRALPLCEFNGVPSRLRALDAELRRRAWAPGAGSSARGTSG